MKPIGAIILAAGAASRFGAAKQLLEIDGETLVDRACRVAAESGCQPIVRMLGAGADEIRQRPVDRAVITLINEEWQRGMGSTLAMAIAELEHRAPACEAVLVLLCDQPLIDAAMLRQMIDRLEQPEISIVIADHGEATGPPALFHRCHFPELKLLTGDRGAKLVANQHPGTLATVSMPEARWDIDSQELWNEFQNSRNASITGRSE
jgi:molybdenum cofactor cytidylyltransferase